MDFSFIPSRFGLRGIWSRRQQARRQQAQRRQISGLYADKTRTLGRQGGPDVDTSDRAGGMSTTQNQLNVNVLCSFNQQYGNSNVTV